MGRSAKIAVEGQTKRCPKCEQLLLLDDYNKGNGMFGKRSICKKCESLIQTTPERKQRRRELELLRRQNPEYVLLRNNKDTIRRHSNLESLKKSLLRSAKGRAKNKNLNFDITLNNFELVDTCPLLNIPLTSNLGMVSDNSYSLDRIDNNKGYIKGNVWVVSERANALKGDASLEELELLVKNLRDHWIH